MSKAKQIREMLKAGGDTKDIAKKLKVKPAYVHTINWQMKNAKPKKAKVKEPVNLRDKLKGYIEHSNHLQDVERTKQRQIDWTDIFEKPRWGNSNLFTVDVDEAVNSPKHYVQGGIETIDFIEAKKLGYNLGNVVKYVSRAEYKGRQIEDLKKARWYLDREIVQMEESGE